MFFKWLLRETKILRRKSLLIEHSPYLDHMVYIYRHKLRLIWVIDLNTGHEPDKVVMRMKSDLFLYTISISNSIMLLVL